MDFNKEYIRVLEIVQNALLKRGEKAGDKDINARLGKSASFMTDKRKGKGGGFTEEDVIWLQYKFKDELENPTGNKTEGVKKDNKGSGKANSGQSDQIPATVLEQIVSAQGQLQKAIESLKGNLRPPKAGRVSKEKVRKVSDRLNGN